MILYCVKVIDRLSGSCCVVGDMLSSGEAHSIEAFLSKFGACQVVIEKSFVIWRKKK